MEFRYRVFMKKTLLVFILSLFLFSFFSNSTYAAVPSCNNGFGPCTKCFESASENLTTCKVTAAKSTCNQQIGLVPNPNFCAQFNAKPQCSTAMGDCISNSSLPPPPPLPLPSSSPGPTSLPVAQNPVPKPLVPCNQVRPDLLHLLEDEFHSLRPYQASPCLAEMASTAKFCGNDLTLHEKVTVSYPGSEDYLTGCVTSGSTVTCNYSVPVDETITLNLNVANLPFMGNTEDVKNSQNSTEVLDSANKVNQYVSWYLNGVLNRAEYPFPETNRDCIGETTSVAGTCSNTALGICLSPNPIPFLPGTPNLLKPDGTKSCGGVKSCCVTRSPNAEKVTILDKDKLINYSGPLNKLLPQEVQQQQRAQSVKDAVASSRLLFGAGIRHDQVVACTYGINILGKEIGGIPGPCYEQGLLSWLPHQPHRLSEWSGHLPPIRSKFKNYIDYENAYQTWRGKKCAEVKVPDIIPVIGGKGVILCLENPLNPNFYSALYPYIPLTSTEADNPKASTEDLKGSVVVEKVSSATNSSVGGVDVSEVTFDNQTPSTLFFAHMQETTGLAGILQDTFVSKDEKGDKTGAPTNVSQPASCTTVDVRSNKGDSLFATPITGNLKYTAAFSCKFDVIPTCSGSCLPNERECRYAGGFAGTGSCSNVKFCCKIQGVPPPPPPPPQTCEKDVYINLSTLSYTPKVEDIWSQLVAGPQSIFKRIFPKTNTPGSVGQIKDMPGSTSITYTSDSTDQQITQATADLKFPHIGSISEYFLKGIQTALRPKGFGEPISFDPVSSSTTGTTFGDICAVATAYNIPCCQLQGIEQVETGGGANLGTESCNTKNGTFSCCNGNVCGPAQINCSQYNGFTGNDKIDVCSTVGASELAARAMLLKLCQADGHCTSYDWSVWGTYVMQNYKIEYGDYTATGYFYGVNSCTPTGCSQLRWGTGKSYCDGVKSYCETGNVLPEVPYNLAYCKQCRDEMVASGMPTFKCSGE